MSFLEGEESLSGEQAGKAFQAGEEACVEAQRNVSMEYSRSGKKWGLFQV